jgi:hypothetical protein
VTPDLVHADPNDVKMLARALHQYEQKLMEITKQTERAINSANWHDHQKEQFSNSFKDFQRQTNSFIGNKVRDFEKKLNALAHDLERAGSHRF